MAERTGKSELAAAALFAAVFVGLLALMVDPITESHPRFAMSGDHFFYHGMATGELHTSWAPYCYRILVPGLVRILPFSVETGFHLQSLVFLWASGVGLFLFLRGWGESVQYSLFGVAFYYGLNWAGKFVAWNFWLTDPALFFFATAALHAILKRNTTALILWTLLGVLAKETIILVVPLYYGIHTDRWVDWRLAGRTLLIGLPSIALGLLLRVFITPGNSYSPLDLLVEHGIPRLTTDIKWTVLGGTLGTWGLLVFLLAMVGLWHGKRLQRAALFFLPLVYLQPLFASNRERLLVLGFLVVIPLAVAGLRWAANRFRLSRWMTAGFVVQPFILILVTTGFRSPRLMVQILTLIGWLAVVLVAKRLAGSMDKVTAD